MTAFGEPMSQTYTEQREEAKRNARWNAENTSTLMAATDRVLDRTATQNDMKHIVNHRRFWSDLLISRYKNKPLFLEDKINLFSPKLHDSLNRVLLVLNYKYGQHMYDVSQYITTLEKESTCYLSAATQDTKQIKINAMKAIYESLKSDTVSSQLMHHVKTTYPQATYGFFSNRSSTLLHDIEVSVLKNSMNS